MPAAFRKNNGVVIGRKSPVWNPSLEIIEHLVEELGVTTRQAEAGAGLLLEFAQQRMSTDEFLPLADAIPAISDVIGMAPRKPPSQLRPWREALSRWSGGLGGLAELIEPLRGVGVEQAMIGRMVDALVEYFRQRGGDTPATSLRQILR